MPTQHTASSQKSRSRAQPKGGARARAAGPSSATDERDAHIEIARRRQRATDDMSRRFVAAHCVDSDPEH